MRMTLAEEGHVAGTEIVEAKLAIGGSEEAMLGAFAVAGKSDVTFAAHAGE